MIAFGCPVSSEDELVRFALPGIERAREADSQTLLERGRPSYQQAANAILDRAAALPGLEALVLLHQDVEILDPDFAAPLRECLRDPMVAVVGAFGSRRVHSLAHWGTPVGGVRAPQLLGRRQMRGDEPWGTVDAVDGLLMALSPWAVQNVRFDRRFEPLDGYDVDYCFQVRARGRRVVVAQLDVAHHAPSDFFDSRRWVRAAALWQRKWGERPTLP